MVTWGNFLVQVTSGAFYSLVIRFLRGFRGLFLWVTWPGRDPPLHGKKCQHYRVTKLPRLPVQTKLPGYQGYQKIGGMNHEC